MFIIANGNTPGTSPYKWQTYSQVCFFPDHLLIRNYQFVLVHIYSPTQFFIQKK